MKIKFIAVAAVVAGMIVLALPISAGASASTERTAINRTYDVISVEYHGAEAAVKAAEGIVYGLKLKAEGECISFLNLKTACADSKATLARDEALLSAAESVESKAEQVMSSASSARETVAANTTLSVATLIGWVHRLDALSAQERAYAKMVAIDTAHIVS